MESLEKELIRGLKVLGEHDRDIRTLTTWCNPNFVRSSDKNVKFEILKILNNLEKNGVISKKKKILKIYKHGSKEFVLYSLI